MYSSPQVSSSTSYPSHFQDTGFSGSMSRQDISSYRSMDAGLTIKTREGDIVTLSTSQFSSLNAHEYNSQGRMETQDGQVSANYSERSIDLASGQTFSFSVEGDLNEQELADIESIVSGIDGIVYQMAEGDMDEAVALALSMGYYDSVSMYEADITVTRAYSAYTEAAAMGSASSLADSNASAGTAASFLPSMNTPFTNEVSRFIEDQEAESLAYARQPLSQLFDYYLAQQAEQEETLASDNEANSVGQAVKSPMTAALESTAQTVDLLIQEMVKNIFENTLYQVA